MKKLCILLILIFWGIFQAYSTENNPRITYSINDSWQFRLGTSDIGEDGWSMACFSLAAQQNGIIISYVIM